MNFVLIASAVAATVISAIGCIVVIRGRLGMRAVAAGEDRWRTDAVPRIGGAAIAAGLLAGSLILLLAGEIGDERALGFLVGAFVIFSAGLTDDLRGLRPLHKLIAQVLATTALVATGTVVEIVGPDPIGILLTFAWVIGITNAFNLLDNMDGLAGGVGLVALIALSVHAALAGLQPVLAIGVVMAAALLGFLPFNLKVRGRASIFMGDSGSQLLGFTAAWLGLAATWSQASGLIAAAAVPILVLAIPLMDTTLVSVTRRMEGRPISQGGRDHSSHRLVLRGLSEKGAVGFLILIAAVLATLSLLYGRRDALFLAAIVTGIGVSVLAVLTLILARPGGAVTSIGAREPSGWLSIDTYRLHKRQFAEGLIDLVLIVVAFYLSFLLRFEAAPDPFYAEKLAQALPILIACRFIALLGTGVYRGLWRYAGVRDTGRIFIAIAVSEAATVSLIWALYGMDGYSRSMFVIDALLCFALIGGARLAERVFGDWVARRQARRSRPPVLVVGAGVAGNATVREIQALGAFHVIGFIDDDPSKRGMRSHGVRVLGNYRDIGAILDDTGPAMVLLTIPNAPVDRLTTIRTACAERGIRCEAVIRVAGLRPDASTVALGT